MSLSWVSKLSICLALVFVSSEAFSEWISAEGRYFLSRDITQRECDANALMEARRAAMSKAGLETLASTTRDMCVERSHGSLPPYGTCSLPLPSHRSCLMHGSPGSPSPNQSLRLFGNNQPDSYVVTNLVLSALGMHQFASNPKKWDTDMCGGMAWDTHGEDERLPP